MKKQTAVDWLVSQLNKEGFAQVVTDKEIEQALALEKEQIIDAHIAGFTSIESAQYYNQTYGK